MTEQDLIQSATRMTDHAYAPYSKFYVGAALLTHAGQLITGCNVENISYGLTLCAERNAIFAAVAQFGKSFSPAHIAIVAKHNGKIVDSCSPCGACRQVIAEWGPETKVTYKFNAEWITRKIGVLMQDCFSIAP